MSMKLKLGLRSGSKTGSLGIVGGGGVADTTRPTCTITSTASGVVAGAFTCTFTFSEDVTGFALGDITVSANAGAGTFATVSASVYTAVITPTSTGTVTVDVAEGVCQDGAGNTNTAATQFSITAIAYSLLDNFTTDDAAPLTTPRTCEPGPGTLVAVDGNGWDISSGVLQAINAGVTNKITSGATYTLAEGLAVGLGSVGLKSGATTFVGSGGFSTGNTSGDVNGIKLDASISLYFGSGLVVGRNASYTTTGAVVVRTASGKFALYVKGGNYSDWHLVWISRAFDTTNRAATYTDQPTASRLSQISSMQVAVLPAPFNSEYGLASSYSATAAANATKTHDANGFIEATRTMATNDVFELSFRQTDADNRWIIRASQAGSTVKIIERNAGVETERGSVAQTFTNGTNYRFAVKCFGNAIYSTNSINGQVLYESATFNASATTCAVSHDVTNFAVYPGYLTGTALSVLQSFNP